MSQQIPENRKLGPLSKYWAIQKYSKYEIFEINCDTVKKFSVNIKNYFCKFPQQKDLLNTLML